MLVLTSNYSTLRKSSDTIAKTKRRIKLIMHPRAYITLQRNVKKASKVPMFLNSLKLSVAWFVLIENVYI